jgi:hypothetical protein
VTSLHVSYHGIADIQEDFSQAVAANNELAAKIRCGEGVEKVLESLLLSVLQIKEGEYQPLCIVLLLLRQG